MSVVSKEVHKSLPPVDATVVSAALGSLPPLSKRYSKAFFVGFWILGIGVWHVASAAIHLLLLVAIVAVVLHFVRGAGGRSVV